MTKSETLKRVREVARVRRLSIHTEQSYAGWIARFCDHARKVSGSREEKVRSFLEMLAPRSAEATQNQALNAIVYLYRDVLGEPLGDLGKWARAKRTARLPTWLSQEEMARMLDAMSGGTKLMAQVAYGSGLRIAELLHLRIKDVDWSAGLITVRGGKGDKDRVTCLPKSLAIPLEKHLVRVRALYDEDRATGSPPVWLPDLLERKFPNAGREWPWFWLWPGRELAKDPRSGVIRRHHVHEATLGKALRAAARRSGISKRVTAHTLRHSFATALLENGASITQVQELLGHASVETTQVYLHCVAKFAETITSPLDVVPPNIVVPFTRPVASLETRMNAHHGRP